MNAAKRKLTRRHVRGNTLLEVIISSSISSMVGIASVLFLVYTAKTVRNYRAYMETSQEVRTLSDTISKDIHYASEIENSYGSYSTGSTTLILKVPAVDADGIPIDVKTKFDRIVYHTQGAYLYREVVPHAESGRDASTTQMGSLIDDKGFAGTFASQPDAQGAEVIHFQFKATSRYKESLISGSARIRNFEV